ncbi:pantothenate synthetase [Palleronia aestuarii]|uniref:Pantothenate synthetase n=1 Tax=Palleronia aestuarii TaxID=568105 RepID=A0A2W7PTW9_9RHOB|nr:pantoate--beta-alanine ligase [Palleronia aestuarii]PZX12909.1 pantothenate synthetase [Palleronia aestuarii]
MIVCRTKTELRAARADMAGRVGLVPTMGYLHDGHMALVARARSENDAVLATIFVNPMQFGPNEDLDTYPRAIERDLAMLEAAGVDAVFVPDAQEMYHEDAQTHVETTGLSRILIGRLRPGHFRGVATVVLKLFNLARPDAAYFGWKDYQQVQVIRTMVRDLDVPVRITGVEIVREEDGLAMSSRNVRLSPEARAAAPVLHAALLEAETLSRGGASVARITARLRARIATAPEAELLSIDLRDAETLAPVRGRPTRPVVALLAARFGDVLLIDNKVLNPEETR